MNPPAPADVTCRCIMATSYPVLTADMTVTDGVRALLRNRLLAIPVVDGNGNYLGQFSNSRFIAAVLPQVAVHDPCFERISRMIDAGLLTDTMADVRDCYTTIASEPVSRHLDPETPVLRPDQPLIAAMFCLFHGRNFLPVVEPETGLLVGVVSTWEVLASIIKPS